jgi:hypothetical protein
LEEVTQHAGHDVLMEGFDNILFIVGDPQGIISQQLRTHPIQLLNIIKLINLHIVIL